MHSLSARYDGDASDTSSVSASAPCSVAAKPAAVLVGKTAYSLPELAAVVVSGDFNLDGKADLAIGDYMGEKISILLGNGDGTFQPSVSYTVSVMPSVIFIDDFNNDANRIYWRAFMEAKRLTCFWETATELSMSFP